MASDLRVQQARKALPVQQAQQGLLAPLVQLEPPEHRGRRALLATRGQQARREQLGHKDQQAQLDPQVRQARKEWRVQQELRGQQGRKATLGRRGRPASLVPPGQKEIRAIQAPLARKESKVQQALLVPLVRPEPPVRRGTRATQARLDRKAHKDHRALLGQRVRQDRRGQLALRATRAPLVQLDRKALLERRGPQVPREAWGHKGRRVLLELREPQARKPRWSIRLSTTSRPSGQHLPCTSPRTPRDSSNGNHPSTWRSAPPAVGSLRHRLPI